VKSEPTNRIWVAMLIDKYSKIQNFYLISIDNPLIAAYNLASFSEPHSFVTFYVFDLTIYRLTFHL
jgi:hypothetical protein